MRIYLLYSLLFFVCTSCGKGGAVADEIHTIDTNDNTYPVLEVTTPTAGQVFSNGNTINVTGKVSDNSLFQGRISIRNDATGVLVKDQYYEIHYIPVYDFSLSYTFAVAIPTNYTVTVKFEDHGYNLTTKAVQVTVTP